MDILSALFVTNRNFYKGPGGATRFDIIGAMFSTPAPREVPVQLEPHLLVIVRCRADEPGNAIIETVFKNMEGEQLARNLLPFTVPPGQFAERLVRAELTFERYETIEAHVRIGQGPWTVVPLTLLPPVEGVEADTTEWTAGQQ